MFYFFWLLPVPILGTIAFLMYRRKQHRLYPVFWAYVCYQALRVALEAILYQVSYVGYFYAYWIGALLSIVFSLSLLRHIFVTVLRNYPALTKLRSAGYELALGFIWTIGLLVTFHHSGEYTYKRMIELTGQAVSFTAVGMFLFVVVSSSILGIKWTEKICGIASALGVLGIVDLLVYAALSHGMGLSNKQASGIETAAYNIAVAIFAFYFLPLRAESLAPQAIRPAVMEWSESMRGAVPK